MLKPLRPLPGRSDAAASFRFRYQRVLASCCACRAVMLSLSLFLCVCVCVCLSLWCKWREGIHWASLTNGEASIDHLAHHIHRVVSFVSRGLIWSDDCVMKQTLTESLLRLDEGKPLVGIVQLRARRIGSIDRTTYDYRVCAAPSPYIPCTLALILLGGY